MAVPSSRDREDLRRRLEAWRSERAGGSKVEVTGLDAPDGTGMSSETLLVEATVDGEEERLVVRMAPEPTDIPVFPSYDLELQARSMQLVAERSDVPVPNVRWYEPDPEPMGAPFFVMDRIDGSAVPDMPPYTFGSWLTEADPADRAKVQESLVSILARLHGIDVSDGCAAFLDRPQYGDTALDQHLGAQRAYYEWAREGVSYPTIEKAFDWLEANRPDPRPPGLNWGDSRLGNVLWREYAPQAVVDWEMAALGPPEVDVMWALHLHHFFYELPTKYGMPDLLTDFMRFDDVVGRYEELSGRTLQDTQYWLVFAALRYAIVSIRTTMRAVRNGDLPAPATPDDALMNGHILLEYMEGNRPR